MSTKKYKTIAALWGAFCFINCEHVESMRAYRRKRVGEARFVVINNGFANVCYEIGNWSPRHVLPTPMLGDRRPPPPSEEGAVTAEALASPVLSGDGEEVDETQESHQNRSVPFPSIRTLDAEGESQHPWPPSFNFE
ncbi:MAG: hypothetical protein LBC04_00770 [Holosporaceae bacterium]|nr:hypothetical protein [Holosporaceae bacterium]